MTFDLTAVLHDHPVHFCCQLVSSMIYPIIISTRELTKCSEPFNCTIKMVAQLSMQSHRLLHALHELLQAGIVNLTFKTTVDDIEWSDSKRVDCVLY